MRTRPLDDDGTGRSRRHPRTRRVFGRPAPGRRTGERRRAAPVPLRPRDRRGTASDVLAILAAAVLVGLGLANLLAVDGPDLAGRQAVVAVLGFVALAAARHVRARTLVPLAWIVYGVAVVALLAVLVAGLEANGATRWIALGPFTFQPSELAKFGLLLVLAGVLGATGPQWRRVALALAATAVPVTLTLLQPDLSTSTLLVVSAVAVLVVSRVSFAAVLGLLSAALVVAPLAVGFLRPYQVERLGSFLVGSAQSPSGSGWAVEQARIALGSSAIWGPGDPGLTALMARYLPERDTDLAPASVVEQYGLVAGGLMVAAGIVLVWRLAVAGRTSRTPQGALLAAGLAVLFGVEIVVSLGGNLGLLPLAGVPFPMVSYGGTALLVHLAAIGTVLGVRREGARRTLWTRSSARLRPRMVRTLAVGISFVLLAFAGVAWDLNARRGDELTAVAHEQMTRCVRLPAPRGAITDRDGVVLARSGAGPSTVGVVPALLRSRPHDLARVAALTGRPTASLRAQLEKVPATTLTVPVAQLPPQAGARVEAAGIDAVMVLTSQRRGYPTGPLFAPVLGYTGVATPSQTRHIADLGPDEIVGRAGLERRYDAVLRGIDGEQCVSVTPSGVPVATAEHQDPVPGADLRLAVDSGLQQRLAAALTTALQAQSNPRAVGSALAMDPRDGSVRAMVSLPAYDNNLFGPPIDGPALRAASTAPGDPMLEHATQSAVPPGSTFKLVVAAANTARPVLPPEQVVPTGAEYVLGGHVFHNWKPMGPMDMVQSIAWSNDVYFYKLAAAMGPERIVETARALGVGEPTGIDLPAESAGLLGSPDDTSTPWYGGTTVILGIGQGPLQVTPLQNARWTGAVSTGALVTPHLGLATGTPASGFTPLPVAKPAPVPFARTLGPVRDGMRAAVTGGTAGRLSDLPVPVAAKTGTAQDGSLPGDTYDNWISAVAPADDPSLVVTVMVQGTGKGANSPTGVAHQGLSEAFRSPG